MEKYIKLEAALESATAYVIGHLDDMTDAVLRTVRDNLRKLPTVELDEETARIHRTMTAADALSMLEGVSLNGPRRDRALAMAVEALRREVKAAPAPGGTGDDPEDRASRWGVPAVRYCPCGLGIMDLTGRFPLSDRYLYHCRHCGNDLALGRDEM